MQKACVYFKGEHYKDVRDIFLYWTKLVGMPRFSIPPDEIANVNSLEELAGMSYAYSCKEEEEYYTKWRKDLETNAYNEGAKEAAKEAAKIIARNLASMGMNTEQIAIATRLSAEDVLAALQTAGKL